MRFAVQSAGNHDAHKMVEYCCKIEDKVKALQSEIKKNIQGTNSEGKKTSTQISGLEQKEGRNIQPEQKEETFNQNRRKKQEFKKNEERLRNL